jgi:predicted MFS family arabinose efflux permease
MMRAGAAALQRAAVLFLVAALSLTILLFVGRGEALRTYERFQLDRLGTQAELVRSAVEPLLNAGVPLSQFGGFETLAKRVLESDPSLVAVAVFDTAGKPVYRAGPDAIGLLPPPAARAAPHAVELRRGAGYRQATARLVTRFGELGTVAVAMPEAAIAGPVERRFAPLMGLGAALAVLFAVLAALLRARGGRAGAIAAPAGFALLFVAMSGAVGASLVQLYEAGATAKTQALSASLAQRLRPFVAMGLTPEDFSGLDRTFAEYRKLNPDLSALALVVDGRVVVDTEAANVGQPWREPGGAYVYQTDLAPGGAVRLALAIPTELVWRQVLRSGKDFAALFIAAILLARLFFGLADTFAGTRADARGRALALLRPAFLLAVLAENLIVSFLPQHLARVAAGFAAPETATSILFMTYFLCFALSLAPAGRMAERRGPRPAIVAGAALAAIGFVPLVATTDFLLTALARAVAGMGQGLLLAGTQAYVLAAADPARRTQGTSIIVYGFNAGMIAGAALGSLLASFVGEGRVIILGAVLTALVAAYAVLLIPRQAGVASAAGGSLWRDIGRALGDLGFLRTLLLIGAPAKAVLTGVVMFALPLLLAGKGYPPQDIGQIVMLYALGVLLVTGRAARLVDRLGRSDRALVWGALLSGLALAGIGLADRPGPAAALGAFEPWAIAAAVFLLGAAHGLINAPVVTHVAGARLAQEIGAGTVAGAYRFLERAGHVAGPLIVGQIWALGGSATGLMALGAAIAALALAFRLFHPRPQAVPAE